MENSSPLFRIVQEEGRTTIVFLQTHFSESELADCSDVLKAIASERSSQGDTVGFDLNNLIVCPSGLMAMMVWLRRFAPRLQLLNVSEPVLEALATTQLDQFFEIPQLK